MGFLDKVKDTATKAAEKVQQGAEVAQDKIEETKLKKKVGDLKEELGGVVYAQRAGGATGDAEADITRLVGEIAAVEAQIAAAAASDTGADPSSAAPDPSSDAAPEA
jgi:hypothetical protein